MILQIEKPTGAGDQPVQQQQQADSGDEGQVAIAASAAVEVAISSLDPQMVMDKVTDVARQATAGDDMDMDSPLMDLGMDSLSSVAFRNSLMAEFQGLSLPASLMFDYPNIRLISEEILDVSRSKAVSFK